MLGAIRYVWSITAGYRLRPWRSPYVRWRLETYFGLAGEVKDFRSFYGLLWRRRHEMADFMKWVEQRRQEQKRRSTPAG